MSAIEINFDGIVGPTHHYAGLSFGNLASSRNVRSISRPREAALEGLAKMKFLADLGVAQAVLPPQERPVVSRLRASGFTGTDAEVLQRAVLERPDLLSIASSASSMWAANAATVSPSADCRDGRVHFTPANLASTEHRKLETAQTATILQRIFLDGSRFNHHAPLPLELGDEGAANHTRLCAAHGGPGIEIFTWGRSLAANAKDERVAGPAAFPARQTLEASRAIAAAHHLRADGIIFVQQNPAAIDAGVFHNDVACVGNENVLFIHERAWVDQAAVLETIRGAFKLKFGGPLHVIEILEAEFPLADAVATYLFNSQIVTLTDGSMALIAPEECREQTRARQVIDHILSLGTPIRAAHFVSVRQSMRNGGGPACLRLRVVLNEAERAAVHRGVLLNDDLYHQLVEWVRRNYREELRAEDLGDFGLLQESRRALDELTGILGMGAIYPFQMRSKVP